MNFIDSKNGLEVLAIRTCNGAKFSPNLYRWLTAKGRTYRSWTAKVYIDEIGMKWIGDIDEGWFTGARLMAVLCNGARENSGAYPNLSTRLTEIEDFWPRYTRDGRCAIDTEHQLQFVGSETRWSIEGVKRSCQWCGQCTQLLRRWTMTVERSAWEAVK